MKYIDPKKEYMYDKCKSCIHASFKVAQGLHPDYGWYVQICNCIGRCKPESKEPTLFDNMTIV